MELFPPPSPAPALPIGDETARSKNALRRSMRRLRQQVTPFDATRAGRAAADHLRCTTELLPLLGAGAMVALYAAMPEELPTAPLAELLLARGVALAFPRVIRGQRRLSFHRIADPGELRPGTLDIHEPPADAPVVPVERFDLFVVPGLAFDAVGNRLGFGKGHYDSTLTDNPRALRVGFAYEFQVVERVPAMPGDAPMNLVVTDAGVRRCGR